MKSKVCNRLVLGIVIAAGGCTIERHPEIPGYPFLDQVQVGMLRTEVIDIWGEPNFDGACDMYVYGGPEHAYFIHIWYSGPDERVEVISDRQTGVCGFTSPEIDEASP